MTTNKAATWIVSLGIAIAASAPSVAVQNLLATFPLSSESMQQWKLPGRLKEISGLALTPDGRLFAINDEIAAIYEIDYANGKVIKAFAFGDPVLRGDFEGIAVLEGKVWLTTSTGDIYSGKEGANGEQMPFRRYRTGLGDHCEIEGLASSAKERTLFLACKKLAKRSKLGELAIFAWSLADEAVREARTVTLPERQIRRELDSKKFHPSGITIAPQNGNFLIVASRQRALAELTPQGELVSAREFELAGRHRQAEGIEIARDARLLVADEGGSHKARLAVYWQEGARPEND